MAAKATPKVKPIPDEYPGATPYICCKNAAQALDFYKKAFGAVEIIRLDGPGGKLAHGEFKIGKAVVMLADEYPDMKFLSPLSIGGTPVTIYIYVEDVDTLVDRAVKAGATLVKPVQDQFYGDRSGQLKCPYGHSWGFATHIEDVPPEEVSRRAAAMMGG